MKARLNEIWKYGMEDTGVNGAVGFKGLFLLVILMMMDLRYFLQFTIPRIPGILFSNSDGKAGLNFF